MDLTNLNQINFLSTSRRTRGLVTVVMIIIFIAVLESSTHTNNLQRVLKRGVLTILTTESATTFYEKSGVCNGFEFLIANDFAKKLGVELEIKTKMNFEELNLALHAGEGDLIAANVTQTALAQNFLNFSKPYHFVSEQLIYRRGNPKPSKIEDLSGTMVLSSQPSFLVTQIKETLQDNPRLFLIDNPSLSNTDKMQMVHTNYYDYSIVDSLSVNMNRHIFHRLAVGIEISEKKPLSWGFLKDGDKSLLSAANLFIRDFITQNKIDAIKQKMFLNPDQFSTSNSQLLEKMEDQRLPKYRHIFKKIANQRNFEWELLAAIAYQESHWDALATSPTGVRGLMMLTQDTAIEMEIQNRLDPLQSVLGGAKYLEKLITRFPKRLDYSERIWLALAAYNFGLRNIEEARAQTQTANKDPDLWVDVRSLLLHLNKKSNPHTGDAAYTNGKIAVKYVDSIKYYLNYLRLRSLLNGKEEPSTKRCLKIA